jgi:hypothetical protein
VSGLLALGEVDQPIGALADLAHQFILLQPLRARALLAGAICHHSAPPAQCVHPTQQLDEIPQLPTCSNTPKHHHHHHHHRSPQSVATSSIPNNYPQLDCKGNPKLIRYSVHMIMVVDSLRRMTYT